MNKNINLVILEGEVIHLPIRERNNTVSFRLWCRQGNEQLEQLIFVKGQLAHAVMKHLNTYAKVLVTGNLFAGIVEGKRVKLLSRKIAKTVGE